MVQSSLPGGQDQARIDALTDGPTDDPPAVKIQDGGQIDRRACAGNVGNISYPNLIGPAGRRLISQAIGSNRMLMIAIGRPDPVAAPLPAVNVLFAHEAAQAVAAVSSAPGSQAGLDARTAVGLAALLVNASDLLLEQEILLSPS